LLHNSSKLGQLTRQTTINAPPERVFEFVADAYNAPRFISTIARIDSGPKGKAEIGQTWEAGVNFLGRPVDRTLRLVEMVSPKLMRVVLEGEPQATLTIGIAPDDTPLQSRVSLTLEAPSVPTFLLETVTGTLLAADVERLKKLLEA
jgi:uncharacterized protein YndB with AHSA1/START domain